MILILGSTGMVGTAIKKVCINKNIPILSPTHKELDITNREKVNIYIKKYNPDIIINCAAIVGREPCLRNKELTYKVNVESVKIISEICSKEDILFIQISSASVFDEKRGYYKETDLPNPTSFYGRTKRIAELHVLNSLCKYYIIRLPLLFGPRSNDGRGLTELFINKIKKDKDVYVAVDKIECFGYTNDIANEIINIINKNLPYGIYHIRNSGTASLYKYIYTINEYLGSPSKIHKAKCKDFKSNSSNLILLSTKIKFLKNWKKSMKEYIYEFERL
jgi:dTDP-4-dehydrorhamnose reductase